MLQEAKTIHIRPVSYTHLGTIDNLKSYLFISLKNKLCDELRKRMYMSDTAIEDVNAVAPTDVERCV